MPGTWVFPGGAVDPGDGAGLTGARTCAIRELLEETAIALPPARDLVLFSRWTTPEIVPLRFEASFFLAEAPPGAEARVDGSEIVAARWFEADEALRAHSEDEITLPFPTVHQLMELAKFTTNDDTLRAYRGAIVVPILPTVTVDEGRARISYGEDHVQT